MPRKFLAALLSTGLLATAACSSLPSPKRTTNVNGAPASQSSNDDDAGGSDN